MSLFRKKKRAVRSTYDPQTLKNCSNSWRNTGSGKSAKNTEHKAGSGCRISDQAPADWKNIQIKFSNTIYQWDLAEVFR